MFEQIQLAAVDWVVVLFPPLDFARRHVTLIVMLGMSAPAIGFRFDQDRPTATARKLCRALRHFITGKDVISVND